MGQVIKSVPFQKEIDVSLLQSGMYFIEIKIVMAIVIPLNLLNNSD